MPFFPLALSIHAMSQAVGVEPSEDSHAYVLVLELCEGETLDLRLKMSGPMLEKERALRMEELVLEGASNDLKPGKLPTKRDNKKDVGQGAKEP